MDGTEIATLITSIMAIGGVVVGGVTLGMRQGRFESSVIEKIASLDKSLASTDVCVDSITPRVGEHGEAISQLRERTMGFANSITAMEARHTAAVEDLKAAMKEGFAEVRADIRSLRGDTDSGVRKRGP